MKKALIGIAVGAALLSAGCSSKEKERLDVAGRPDSAVLATSTTVAGGSGGEAGANTPPGGTANPTPGGPNNGTGTTQPPAQTNTTHTTVNLPMSIEVESACVKPGDNQTVTIKTRPGAVAGYNALYSDGKSGGMDGHWGGNAGGEVDKDGVYKNTFVVNIGAPEGFVLVETRGARGSNELGYAKTSFNVANRLTGKCS